ncbi:MAG: 5'/3'-nucleotidase SurE [Thermodesulfobacteriota bacterium]
MKILLTNDDGIHAPGLLALEEVLRARHEVTVVAPDRERSAISHAITLNVPLRAIVQNSGRARAFAVTGTPADCVKLALLELLESPPDIVLSGVNPGPNVGVNLNYSGTVSAAKEAAILGHKAIAVSVAGRDGKAFAPAAEFAEALARKVMEKGLPRGVFLNVNYPDAEPSAVQGVRICRQGSASIQAAFFRRTDPREQTYYWQGSETQLFGERPDEDGVALAEKYIAVTPVTCDMTDHGFLSALAGWGL